MYGNYGANGAFRDPRQELREEKGRMNGLLEIDRVRQIYRDLPKGKQIY
jgi:hypothetical protein